VKVFWIGIVVATATALIAGIGSWLPLEVLTGAHRPTKEPYANFSNSEQGLRKEIQSLYKAAKEANSISPNGAQNQAIVTAAIEKYFPRGMKLARG
jgi:hypothetical protein